MPKNNRKKHAGDEVEGGLGCTEAGCSKRYNHVSSWGRHLAADHGFTPAQSLGMVVAVRRDVLGPLGERFDTPRLCPVCKTAFSVKEGLMGHLRDKHGKTDEEVNQALLCETVTSDRYHTPVSCPRCDGAKTWPRKSHLAKHLLKMHGMTSEHAQLVAADPTLDGAAGSQSVAMGASAAMNHSTDIPSVAEDMDAEMNYSADSQSVAEDIDAEMNHSADSQSVADRNRSTEQPGGDAVAVVDAVVDPVADAIADAIADAFGVDDAVAVAEQPGGEVVASTSGARTLAPPEKRSGRRGPAFSDAEREVLKTAFFVNGKQPTGITNAAVDLAKKNYPEFAALYDKIYKDKNKNPREVIMTIRKSIIKKKK